MSLETVLAGRFGNTPPLDLAALDRLPLNVLEVQPLSWKEGQITPLYLVTALEGRYVLKTSTPRPHRNRRLEKKLAALEIEHQADILAALQATSHEHLRFPRLIDSDRRTYLLLEYIETQPHGEHDLPAEPLLRSLLEFQLTPAKVPLRLIPDAGRTPGMMLARLAMGKLRVRYGAGLSLRVMRLMAECYRAQERLPVPYLRHNDFHHNNLMLGRDGEIYLTDFEYALRDRRWIFGDAIHYAVGTRYFHIETSLIRRYAELLERERSLPLRLNAQVRFGLLLRVVVNLTSGAPPEDVARRYGGYLEEVLLDDVNFSRWLDSNLAG